MRIWSPYKQQGMENGNVFYGTKGMMILGKKEGWKLYREQNQLVKEGDGGPDLNGHHQDFIDCIRNNKRSRADIEIGHLLPSLCHLGNIAIRTGEMLHFDPVKEQMKDNEKANKLVRRQYREHWGTSQDV